VKNPEHWHDVIDDLTMFTFGMEPPPPKAFDRLLYLSREEGIPRWAIVAAVAEAEGVARKDVGTEYEFDLPTIEASAREKHVSLGFVRESQGHEL
jgi:hypothetical protein